MEAFLRGLIAGYGIAVPVGAIAVLIVEMGLRSGFFSAFMAGAGAATADLLYASLAALTGTALSSLLTPLASGLRIASGLVLAAIGLLGLRRVWLSLRLHGRVLSVNRPPPERLLDSPWRIYLRFVGLTLLNPLTITYFAALILSGETGIFNWSANLLFVAGAALASLSWQSLLAGLGALAHSRLSPRFQTGASLLGNLIVLALGLRILFIA